jgi:hypothetical protein
MANSDFDMTRTQIITAAIRKLGALASGASPNSAQLSDGADALNMMVKSWQNIGIRLWTVEWETQTMNSGTATYSPDPILDIQKAFIRRDSDDYPVTIVGMQDYFDIPDKTETGLPQLLAYQAGKTGPEYTVWPVPENSTDVLHYLQVRKLQDFDAATDKPDFPSRWISALTWGLAGELAREFSVPVEVENSITSRASAYLEMAIRGEKSQSPADKFVKSAY